MIFLKLPVSRQWRVTKFHSKILMLPKNSCTRAIPCGKILTVLSPLFFIDTSFERKWRKLCTRHDSNCGCLELNYSDSLPLIFSHYLHYFVIDLLTIRSFRFERTSSLELPSTNCKAFYRTWTVRASCRRLNPAQWWARWGCRDLVSFRVLTESLWSWISTRMPSKI